MPNPAAANLELIPNNQDGNDKPVEFVIEFTVVDTGFAMSLLSTLGLSWR